MFVKYLTTGPNTGSTQKITAVVNGPATTSVIYNSCIKARALNYDRFNFKFSSITC